MHWDIKRGEKSLWCRLPRIALLAPLNCVSTYLTGVGPREIPGQAGEYRDMAGRFIRC